MQYHVINYISHCITISYLFYNWEKLKNFLMQKKHDFITTKLQTTFCWVMGMHLITETALGVTQCSGPDGPSKPAEGRRSWYGSGNVGPWLWQWQWECSWHFMTSQQPRTWKVLQRSRIAAHTEKAFAMLLRNNGRIRILHNGPLVVLPAEHFSSFLLVTAPFHLGKSLSHSPSQAKQAPWELESCVEGQKGGTKSFKDLGCPEPWSYPVLCP